MILPPLAWLAIVADVTNRYQIINNHSASLIKNQAQNRIGPGWNRFPAGREAV
jgi:hypothetical protein